MADEKREGDAKSDTSVREDDAPPGSSRDGSVGGSGGKGGGMSSLTADGNEKLPNQPKK